MPRVMQWAQPQHLHIRTVGESTVEALRLNSQYRDGGCQQAEVAGPSQELHRLAYLAFVSLSQKDLRSFAVGCDIRVQKIG